MASIDIEERVGPRSDRLGLGLFVFHIVVSLYVLTGWTIASYDALTFYLLLLPLIALQWRLNRGSCVINNLESWLRSGHWHDPENREEGAFLRMLSDWLLGARLPRYVLDNLSYAVVFVLWLAGFSHFLLLYRAG